MSNNKSFFDEKQVKLFENDILLVTEKHIEHKSRASQLHKMLIDGTIYDKNIPIEKDTWLSKNGDTFNDFEVFLNNFKKCQSKIYRTEKKIINQIACNSFSFCPMCCSRKSSESIRRIMKPLKKIIDEKKLFLYFACATQKDDANDNYDRLRLYLTRFFKMGQKRNGERSSNAEASKICGYIEGIEIKPSIHGWHTHAHLILATTEQLDFRVYEPEQFAQLAKKYGYGHIPKEKLSEILLNKEGKSKLTQEWALCSDGATNFDIKLFKQEDLMHNVYETVKYFVKTSDLTPTELFNVWAFLRYKKRFSITGVFKEKNLLDQERKEKISELVNVLKTVKKNYLDRKTAAPQKKDHPEAEPEACYFIDYKHEYYIDTVDYTNDYINWFQSDEYKLFLIEKNQIIALSRNVRKEAYQQYTNGEISKEWYIEIAKEINAFRKQNIIKAIIEYKTNYEECKKIK